MDSPRQERLTLVELAKDIVEYLPSPAQHASIDPRTLRKLEDEAEAHWNFFVGAMHGIRQHWNRNDWLRVRKQWDTMLDAVIAEVGIKREGEKPIQRMRRTITMNRIRAQGAADIFSQPDIQKLPHMRQRMSVLFGTVREQILATLQKTDEDIMSILDNRQLKRSWDDADHAGRQVLDRWYQLVGSWGTKAENILQQIQIERVETLRPALAQRHATIFESQTEQLRKELLWEIAMHRYAAHILLSSIEHAEYSDLHGVRSVIPVLQTATLS